MRLRPLWVGAVVVALACGAAGCSYRLGAMGKDDKAEVEHTGSIAPAKAAGRVSETAPPESDLVFAKAAAQELLSKGGDDTSLAWENPQSGARGTVTPLAAAYGQSGFTCRDFLASYVRAGAESWLQGEACRLHHGKWEVRNLRPWKQT